MWSYYQFNTHRDELVYNRKDMLKIFWPDAAKHNGFGKAYLRGDADLDGTVNATDLNALALNWQGNTSTWSGGDFIVDGVVNVEYLNELALNWRESIPTAAAVSEPKCLAMLAIALGFIGFARRR